MHPPFPLWFDASFPEKSCEPAKIRIYLIVSERVPNLHDAIIFESQEKGFYRRALTRPHRPLTPLFLENWREYPHKPCIARNYRVSANDLRHWQYVSMFSSFHAIIFESQTNRHENNLTQNSHSMIQGHAFWDDWKTDDGLRIAM